jgi:hypothetical protein
MEQPETPALPTRILIRLLEFRLIRSQFRSEDGLHARRNSTLTRGRRANNACAKMPLVGVAGKCPLDADFVSAKLRFQLGFGCSQTLVWPSR